MQEASKFGLRNKCMYFMSHSGIMRGQDIRMLELSGMFSTFLDIFSIVQDAEETGQNCLAVVSVIRQGKTNHFGKKQMAGFYRHKDVEICPVSALGFYFFYRFAIAFESFPKTNNPQDWYEIKLFHNWSDLKKELHYNSHKEAVQKCFDKLGFNFNAVTHIGRKSAANMADSFGAAGDSIKRAGRWNTETVTNVYMSALPKDVLKVYA